MAARTPEVSGARQRSLAYLVCYLRFATTLGPDLAGNPAQTPCCTSDKLGTFAWPPEIPGI